MTFGFRRLGDLLEDVRYRFSAAGVKLRHPAPRIIQLFNVSWVQTRTIVSLADDGTFLNATAPAPLPTTAAVTGEVYSEIAWPIGAMRIYGVRVQPTASSRWYALQKVPWSAFHDFQYDQVIEAFRHSPGPRAYCSRSIPSATEATEVAGAIMVMPVPRGGTFRLWYMESYQPQVEDDDLIYGHDEWFEYAIYATMIKMLGPDADSKKNYDQWAMERTEARKLIEATATRLSDGMAMEPRDARGDGDDLDRWGAPL